MKKSARVLLHVCFWAIFPITFSFYNWAGQAGQFPGLPTHSKNFFQVFFTDIQSLFIHPDAGSELFSLSNGAGIFFNIIAYSVFPLGVFYLFYFHFIPKALSTRRTMARIIPVVFVLVIPFVIIKPLSYMIFTIGFAGYYYSLSITYIITAFFASAGFFFRILENWVQAEKTAKQNLQSELALLKNQVNPHFLFNTLNNIDSLIKSDAGKASETLLKLSDILRYMLYDTTADKVKLTDEIRYIESYAGLQKMQFSNPDLVSFSVNGHPDNIMIAPMLFIPFVENAFKHCTDKSTAHAIRFTFSIENNFVHFESVNVSDKAKPMTKDPSSGIGLANTRRRLEIIYPGKHELQITDENSIFTVALSVQTDEHSMYRS